MITGIKRGRIKYIPKIMLIELEDIKREDGISMDCEGFRKMVSYARVGRETNRFINFGYDWSKKAKLPPIDLPPKKKKQYKNRSIFGDLGF